MAETEGETASQDATTGKFYFDNGATYEGEWKCLEETSEGESDAVVQEATKRVRHGKGKYVEGGYSYEGEWHEDQMHGRGEFRFAGGSVYAGEFKMNAYHGHGTFTWADGTAYTGEWRDGKMHGEGRYVDKGGREWDGQFYNGAGPGLKLAL